MREEMQTQGGRAMAWTRPDFEELRYGFEATWYIDNR
jgi:coenzyme PQQ precursor peptide PqqA